MEEVRVGDVVQLNSGGPLMTVVEVKDIGIRVYWFPNTCEPTLQSEILHHETYKKITL